MLNHYHYDKRARNILGDEKISLFLNLSAEVALENTTICSDNSDFKIISALCTAFITS